MSSFRELQSVPEAEFLFWKPMLPFPQYAYSLSSLFQILLIHRAYCSVVPQLVTETLLENWHLINRFLVICYAESFKQEVTCHS